VKTYTICLTGLDRYHSVVVGGGIVANRKVAGLLDAGAFVQVISPELCPELASAARRGDIQVIRREYQGGDLQGARLAIAATGDPQVNARIARDGQACGCLVNVVDDPQHSDFILPAVVRRGEMTIAISTGGASPALAHCLRERLEQEIDPGYGELARLLAETRPELLVRFKTSSDRLAAVRSLLESGMLAMLEDQGYEAALSYARQHFSSLETRGHPESGLLTDLTMEQEA
jgi:precorrin-2 dehydrogenase/sirohydrochlorin ferrochelatase